VLSIKGVANHKYLCVYKMKKKIKHKLIIKYFPKPFKAPIIKSRPLVGQHHFTADCNLHCWPSIVTAISSEWRKWRTMFCRRVRW